MTTMGQYPKDLTLCGVPPLNSAMSSSAAPPPKNKTKQQQQQKTPHSDIVMTGASPILQNIVGCPLQEMHHCDVRDAGKSCARWVRWGEENCTSRCRFQEQLWFFVGIIQSRGPFIHGVSHYPKPNLSHSAASRTSPQ